MLPTTLAPPTESPRHDADRPDWAAALPELVDHLEALRTAAWQDEYTQAAAHLSHAALHLRKALDDADAPTPFSRWRDV